MHDDQPQRDSAPEDEFSRQVFAKANRKLKAQRAGQSGVWFGLGMMGLIGWSVAVPAAPTPDMITDEPVITSVTTHHKIRLDDTTR